MTFTIDGPKKWQAEVLKDRGVLRVTFVCPTCRRDMEIALQAPPWHEPVGEITDDALAAGEVVHVELDEIRTQVWCHRCQIGADVTIREG